MERDTVILWGVGSLLLWGLVAKPIAASTTTPPATPDPGTGGLPASGGSPPADPIVVHPNPRVPPQTPVVPPPVIIPDGTSPTASVRRTLPNPGPAPDYTPGQVAWLRSTQYNGTILTKAGIHFFTDGTPPDGVPVDAIWWAIIPNQLPQYGFSWPTVPAGIA